MENIDTISYPRNLNRPTYIVWRFTHRDVTLIAAVFFGLYLPVVAWSGYPVGAASLLGIAFLLYRGVVVAVKPRGWDLHVLQSWRQPKLLVAGHTLRRILVLPEVSDEPGRWDKLRRAFRRGR